MILSFTTKWRNGTPTYFPEKIWMDLLSTENNGIDYCTFLDFNKLVKSKSGYEMFASMDKIDFAPKLHTIREDKHNRWNAGMDIHFRIFNRTKNTAQFAPVVKCESVQGIEIYYGVFELNDDLIIPKITIDKRVLLVNEMTTLALNDGFEDLKSFLKIFNYNFKGKIIHWTNLKY